jgi:hypothetical protein
MRAYLAIAVAATSCHDRSERSAKHTSDPTEERWRTEDAQKCERLIPLELRTRYFADLPLFAGPRVVVGMVDCKFAPPGTDWDALALGRTRGADVNIACGADVTSDARLKDAAELYRSGERIPDLGKLALAWPPTEVRFWDRDCAVSISWWLGDRNALPFARDLHASMLTVPESP